MSEREHVRPSIAAVLGRYGMDVTNRSGWRPIRCGFHDDRTPSASVNTDLGAFRCLACGVGGDVYKILMEQEGIGFREALILGDELDADPSPKTDSRSRRAFRPNGRRGSRR